jgi:hypothetical protein
MWKFISSETAGSLFLSLTSPINRRLAALVALLYVFFSTFGALAHSHARSEVPGAPQVIHGSRQTVVTPAAGGTVPVHCLICEWQSVQVTPPPTPAQVVQPILLSGAQIAVTFRLPSLPALRSSSRGPPLT